eukprot:752309-Hanusia_phi.AAC.2
MAGSEFDYDVIIIGCGVGGHGAALHARGKVGARRGEERREGRRGERGGERRGEERGGRACGKSAEERGGGVDAMM